MAKLHALLQPYVFSSSDRFDPVKAAHLLNRAGFGGKPEEVEAVLELGPQRAVVAVSDFPDASAGEQSKTDLPDLSSVGRSYPKTFAERQRMLLWEFVRTLQGLRWPEIVSIAEIVHGTSPIALAATMKAKCSAPSRRRRRHQAPGDELHRKRRAYTQHAGPQPLHRPR